MSETTLEWFGATTFRLRTQGVTIFLDTWLDKPKIMPSYLSVQDVTEADYIFISHAHFDHLPGADRIAIKTGAIVIANGEAINCLRAAGVPEDQLIPVAGGERIPLFTKSVRDSARAANSSTRAPGPPGAPAFPLPELAAFAVHIWPSLHCLMPEGHPQEIDTGTVYTGAATPYTCTVDITFGMKHALLKLGELIPEDKQSPGHKSFIEYVNDRDTNVFSHYDGGQLMCNFVLPSGKAILWSAHLGAFEGVMREMEPKPSVAIMAIAGRANLNGRPFDGSAAQFAVKQMKWLGEPEKVIWCLHDESPIPPFRIKTEAATDAVERETKSRILTMEPAKLVVLDV